MEAELIKTRIPLHFNGQPIFLRMKKMFCREGEKSLNQLATCYICLVNEKNVK